MENYTNVIGIIGQYIVFSQSNGHIYNPVELKVTTLHEDNELLYKVHTEFDKSDWVEPHLLLKTIDAVRNRSIALMMHHNEHQSGEIIINAQEL